MIKLDTINIVTSVYNDWDCLCDFIKRINLIKNKLSCRKLRIVIVDDGSSITPDQEAIKKISSDISQIILITLHCNLGHQKAIAIGLSELVRIDNNYPTIIADCDGEDPVEDFDKLLITHINNPDKIIVASRAKRTENIKFKLISQVIIL